MSAINDTIGSLVKVAEQMIENADSPKTASPEEVLNGLETIIAQLEQIASTIPAEQSQPTQPPQPEKPESTPTPSADNPKVAALEEEVTKLRTELDSTKRAELAKEISSFYSDSKVAQQKHDEIINGKEPIAQLQARLETIAEYANKNNVSIPRHAKNETFSYVRTAQAEKGSTLHTL